MLEALIAAWATGWRPAIVSDALRAMGVVALQPLLAAIEANPALAERKASVDVLKRVPPDELEQVLEQRLAAARTAPDFPVRAALLLRLASAHDRTRDAFAERILSGAGDGGGEEHRALVKAAKRAISAGGRKPGKAKA